MDPATISQVIGVALGATRQAAEVAYHIYMFIHKSRRIEETIRSLQAEVSQAASICSSIEQQLRLLPDEGSEQSLLLINVHMQLLECSAAITAIHEHVRSVSLTKWTFFSQQFQQIRLNLRQDDIANSRRRLQSSISSLQVALQLLNLHAAWSAPSLANRVVLDKMEELLKAIRLRRGESSPPMVEFASLYLEGSTLRYSQSFPPSSNLDDADLTSVDHIRERLKESSAFAIQADGETSRADQQERATGESSFRSPHEGSPWIDQPHISAFEILKSPELPLDRYNNIHNGHIERTDVHKLSVADVTTYALPRPSQNPDSAYLGFDTSSSSDLHFMAAEPATHESLDQGPRSLELATPLSVYDNTSAADSTEDSPIALPDDKDDELFSNSEYRIDANNAPNTDTNNTNLENQIEKEVMPNQIISTGGGRGMLSCHYCSHVCCGNTTFLQPHLQLHIRACHISRRTLRCPLCSKPFKRQYMLEQHQLTVH